MAWLFPDTRVLVVEDEPINREVMALQLEDAGLAPEFVERPLMAGGTQQSSGFKRVLSLPTTGLPS